MECICAEKVGQRVYLPDLHKERWQKWKYYTPCRNTKNGVYGTGFVEEHNQILAVAYKSLIYEKYLVATGGNKKGFLKSSKRLDKDGIEAIKNQWNELHNNTGSTMMVLNEGLDFMESSNTSVEMQLQENKKTNNELICQLFGLSGDVLSGKANDEQYVNAIKIAVVPVVTALQTALNKGLLCYPLNAKICILCLI